MTPDLRFLSYGGGTQSAALALMSAAGDLPRLDAVIFADTQGELPETYEYAEYVKGHLERAGIPFIRLTAGNLEHELISPNYNGKVNPTPPAHVVRDDGKSGRINGYRCSFDFKRRVITAEVKRRCGGRGAWKRVTVEQWLGFSTDETSRCKDDMECRCGHNRIRPTFKDGRPRGHVPACTDCDCQTFSPWRVNRYPLIDMQFRREDTIRWFAANGHPVPPRSACWFCPNSRNPRWRELRDNHPDLFERACVIDDRLRQSPPWNTRGEEFRGVMFLHGDRIPLREVDLRDEAEVNGQPSLFDDAAIVLACEGEACFT